MNVDYDLYEGETAIASVRHTLCRGTMVYDRGEIVTAPGHGRYVARSVQSSPGGGTLSLRDRRRRRPRRPPRPPRALRRPRRRPARSRGRRNGRPPRDWLLAKLEDLPVTVERDPAGNIWATLPGAGEAEGFVIVGSHIDAVPAGGWLDGALGLLAALGVVRALAAADAPPPVEVRLVDWADEEGARFGRSLLGSSRRRRHARPRRRPRPPRQRGHPAAGRPRRVRRRPRRRVRRHREA